nr:entericidin A/B family lipoprotein [Parasulfuritortus cantonensis]
MLLGLVVGLAGCNTLHGAGQDMEKAGEKIRRATR